MAVAEKKDDAVDSKQAPFTEKVSSIAHEAVDKAADRVGPAEESIRATASETAETIGQTKETAALEMMTMSNHARAIVVKNPLIAASAAFAAGLVVTSLLGKRS